MKMAIIGCGKMATAMVLGMPKDKLEFFGYNPTFKKAEDLMAKLGGTAVSNLDDIPACDLYLIGAKPQHLGVLKKTFSPPKDATLISLMAGITIDSLKEGFSLERVIRLMPNTPCLVGVGVVGLIASQEVKDETLSFVTGLLANVGLVQILKDEELMNVITAFTGSGPAYIFEVANILSKLMSEQGFEKEVAQKLVEQMILGAATLMSKASESPQELRNDVTSKGGTTEAALNILKAKNLEGMIESAIKANITRAQELAGENK